jgi:hypothetical protein
MKITEADIVWVPASADVPNAGSIRVERHTSGWQRTPCDRWMPAMSLTPPPTKEKATHQLLAMFILFNTVVVRDGIDPQAAHRAFLAIDEYRQRISPDMEGAE